MNLREAAHSYADEGIRVFPIRPRGKTPVISENLKRATTDHDQIDEWWDQWPEANIGVVCGDGLAVFDIDGPIGRRNYAALVEEYGRIPTTRTAKTPNGHHLWLKDDPDNPLPTGASQIRKKLDTRAGGSGYVVAPPSVRDDGVYEWINDAPMAPVPGWLRDELSKPKQSNPLEATTFEDGERDVMLARVAGVLRHRGFSQAAIEQALLAENEERCNPPLEEAQVLKVARSISRYEPGAADNIFKPDPFTEFGAVEGGEPAPEVSGALAVVDRLKDVGVQQLLPQLDAATAAIEQVENARERALASVLLRRRLKDRLGSAGAVALLQRDQDDGPPFLSLETLMQNPDLMNPPPSVIPELAYRGRAVIIAGPDKSGKSTLVAHAVAALSHGSAFLEQPVDQGSALLVVPDESMRDLVRRLADLGADPSRISIYQRQGLTMLEDVRRQIETDRPDLVVFDSLQAVARLVMGVAPKSAESSEWSEVIRPLVDIAHDLDVAVVILHHVRKSDGQIRDSGEIPAAADGTFTFREARGGEDPRIRHLTLRGRWSQPPLDIKLTEHGYERVETARELPIHSRILLFIQAHPGTSKNKVRQAVLGRHEEIDELLQWLTREGYIENRGSESRSAYHVTVNDPLTDFEVAAEVHGDHEETEDGD